ncbi:MAG: threonine-phosphate decarboxylase [Tropicimonas sp.]|uniref:threonine-phosphate decarboxylase n=1 Tax=Tropicimonas sp. TaxID=2067044 RepID=UPI003A8AC7F5
MDTLAGGRDHGGGLDAACARWGGGRAQWLDLSTGINPVPYPLPDLPASVWTALPDSAASARLIVAARRFWEVPDRLGILPVPGASAAIARLPGVAKGSGAGVHIPAPTYNEHAAAFAAAGWRVMTGPEAPGAGACVLVHPNNPDGRLWSAGELPQSGLLILDESFCDIAPEASLLRRAAQRPETLVLKSFGKFWGLAGLRLGFVIGAPALLATLREVTGPWPVSGPALAIGAAALEDPAWADATRERLREDAERLDGLMTRAGAVAIGGTTLFRLYRTGNAAGMQARLARGRVWSRCFPYSEHWLRLGLPGSEAGWQQLAAALA